MVGNEYIISNSIPRSRDYDYILITEKEGVFTLLLFDKRLDYDAAKGGYYNSKTRMVTYIWNDILKEWGTFTNVGRGPFTYKKEEYGEIYFNNGGVREADSSGRNDLVVLQGRESFPGFVEDEKLDLTFLIEGKKFFILKREPEEPYIMIFLDPQNIKVNKEGLILLEEESPSFKLIYHKDGYSRWDYEATVYSPFNSYYPYNRIYGGSTEVKDEAGNIICPKIKYMALVE